MEIKRHAPPCHYLFKIQSFSLLSQATIEKYNFGEFETGGYKWKLGIHPNGDKTQNGENHISISLELVETSSLPIGWEVNVIFNFFILNHLKDKYLSIQDGKVRRYHAMKTKWGIGKLMDLETFSDPSNGYLVDDACVFGAEVYVIKCSSKGECLKMINEPMTNEYTWKVDRFSTLLENRYQSDSFVVGDYKWRILLYPKGVLEGKGTNMSLFISLDETTLPSDTKLFVKFIFRVKDQTNQKHFTFEETKLFGPTLSMNWGLRKLISLTKLKDIKNGFLVGDTCFVEAVVTVLGTVEPIS